MLILHILVMSYFTNGSKKAKLCGFCTLRWRHHVFQEPVYALLKSILVVIPTVVLPRSCQSCIPLDDNHQHGHEILQALLLLGRIVDHPIHLAHVIKENHNKSQTVASDGFSSLAIRIGLESRPIFEDQLVEVQGGLDFVFWGFHGTIQ